MPFQTEDLLLLQAALIGLQRVKADIDGKMADIRQRLGIEPAAGAPTPKKARRKKRRLSAEGRANIIAALKKRWAMRRKEEAQAASKAVPKRKAKPAPKAKAPAKAAPEKASVRVKRTPPRKTVAPGPSARVA